MKNIARFLIAALFVTLWACSDDMGPDPKQPGVHVQQDTTSHDVVWEVFRFGRVGRGPGIDVSNLRDIYALNDTDVWAVGKIYRVAQEFDTLGVIDFTYNAAHWNGREWEFDNINSKSYGPDGKWKGMREHCDLYAIWVFGHNDLIVSARDHGTLWYNENSTKWGYDPYLHEWGYIKYIPDHYPGFGTITKFWAYSKSDVYSCSDAGPIRRKLNGSWDCLGSGPFTWRLNDIHGSQSGRLWAGGYKFPEDERAFLTIMGNQAAVVNRKEYFGRESAPASGIYVCGDTLYTFVGNAILIQSTNDEDHYRYAAALGTWEFCGYIWAMRGVGHNNIFAAGCYGTILHYNGKSWKQVAVPTIDNGIWFNAISISENYVYIAGYDYNSCQAVVYRCRLPQ